MGRYLITMEKDMDKSIPAPGSPKAMKLGCSCAQFDNEFGRGAYEDSEGLPIYYVTITCIIHGTPPKKDRRKNVSDKAEW
jgi:hypothetical protein